MLAHHWVYEKSGILHRDISVGNVMFYRNEGEAIGVLCDWDLAYDFRNPTKEKTQMIEQPAEEPDIAEDPTLESEDSDNNSVDDESSDGVEVDMKHDDDSRSANIMDKEDPRRPQYRTGTGPFMAYELLLPGEVPLHIYRFDLESFFWLLAWFCAVFDPVEHKYVRQVPWEQNHLFKIGLQKQQFLAEISVYYSTFESAHLQYRDLCKNWVYRLRLYFWSVVEHRGKLSRIANEIDAAKVFGDDEGERRGYERFDSMRKEGENIITYDGFMDILGVKTEDR